MWLVMRDGQIAGYYDTFAEAVQALELERQKEDGTELRIEQERADNEDETD